MARQAASPDRQKDRREQVDRQDSEARKDNHQVRQPPSHQEHRLFLDPIMSRQFDFKEFVLWDTFNE